MQTWLKCIKKTNERLDTIGGFNPAYVILELLKDYQNLSFLNGSETIDLDPSTSIGPIAYADIPEDAKERILGYNAVKLINKLNWNIPGAEF